MSPRLRRAAVYVLTAVALALLWAWKTGYLLPEPSLDPNPVAAARGEVVFKGRCYHCHEAIPIAPRVARWTPEYAYDAIGQLPQLQPAMPPFKGTEQERADLAVYLSVVGATAEPEDAGEADEGEWQPPSFAPPPERPATHRDAAPQPAR